MKEVIKALGLEGASPASSPGVAAKVETRVQDKKGSIDPRWGMRRPPCSVCRGEAELLVPRPEEHEESLIQAGSSRCFARFY